MGRHGTFSEQVWRVLRVTVTPCSKEWKEARESMLTELETHVKGMEAILAKSLERLNLVRPKQGTRDAKQTPRLRVNILLRREKSERLFEQIEDLAATCQES
jgi:hypothetical protein